MKTQIPFKWFTGAVYCYYKLGLLCHTGVMKWIGYTSTGGMGWQEL
jgi:hypothetical protein